MACSPAAAWLSPQRYPISPPPLRNLPIKKSYQRREKVPKESNRPNQEPNGLDLIFHSNTESGKTDDLDSSSAVNLGFLSSFGEWASISGSATVETDRALVHKYYSPALKAWMGDLGDGKHDGGPDDPRIAVIRVKAKTAQYSVSRKNVVSAAFDVAKGAVTGEAPAINKLRQISEGEVQQWRAAAE